MLPHVSFTDLAQVLPPATSNSQELESQQPPPPQAAFGSVKSPALNMPPLELHRVWGHPKRARTSRKPSWVHI